MSDTHPYSLMAILNNDPDYSQILKKKAEAVKKDKASLLAMSELVSEKYQDEISQGTIKRQLMLEDGTQRGLKEHEIFQRETSFIPTKYTPILNILYFMFRENNSVEDKEHQNLEELTKHYIQQYGYEEYLKKLENNENYIKEVYSDELEDILSEESENLEEMEKFVYGEMTNKQFQTIKKLKSLSKSSNESEAFQAYRKCLELCKKFNLEFDKIPCNID